jgi:hypothetical protein
LSPAVVATDANGESKTRWTLGTSAGTNEVSTNVTGLTPVVFSATGAPGGTGVNLTIAGLTLTQVTQNLGGSVPMLQGRTAYLRVFVTASQTNAVRPNVRVRILSGGALVTQTILAQQPSVPLTLTESELALSWNVTVPGSLIQPGLSILADVDPEGAVPESNETDNSYPTSGQPLVVDVRSPAPFNVLFVPVLQSVNGLQGNVTQANQQSYLRFAGRALPLTSLNGAVHPVYTTNAPVLQSNNGNDAWTMILNELQALRVAEGGGRHYYGVVKTSYTSGTAGLGYIGFPVAMGWDIGGVDEVAAHEWGHNFGRRHAPGCGAGGIDPSFPYAQGRIGVYGFEPPTTTLYSPNTHYDLMGYCNPSWISDYNYRAILNYRANSAAPPLTAAREEASLLVWGRIGPGGIVLEPAFEVTTRPSLPEQPGPYTLEGLDDGGAVVFRHSFAANEVSDGPQQHFAFAIPLGQASPERLARLRVSAPGLAAAERRAAPVGLAPPLGAQPLAAQRVTPNAVEVRWDAAASPVAMIRERATGAVLSFARGGVSTLPSTAGDLEVVLSDGVRSSARTVTVR